MALQALIMPLVAVLKGSGFAQASKALRGLDGEFKNVAKAAAFAAVNFSAAGALQNVTQYIDEAIDVTQKYERNILALNQTFQAQAENMRAFTKDAEKMGISQSQAAQASVFLGSVLKQYGLESQVTAGETQKLIGLSQDLATTYGYDLQEALLAMTALFRGEYDPIEKFGVAMKQNEINALLAERGQSKLTGTMQFQAQVQARLDLLYQRSADSMGAFERATGTLYSAQQKLTAAAENQKIAFGTPFQEPIAKVTDVIAKFVTQITPALESIGNGLAGAIGMSLPLITSFFETFTKIVDVIGKATQALYDFGTATDEYSKKAEAAGGYTVAWSNGLSFEAGLESFTPAADALSKKMADLTYEQEQLQAKIDDGADRWGVYEKALQRVIQEIINLKYLESAEAELKRFNLQAERGKTAMDEFRAANAAFAGIPLDEYLRDVATASDDATGKVSTLSQAFATIDEAIAQSNAKESLEGLGLSAGLIEKVLTDPNWEEIFGKIRRLAVLTAIDIGSISSMLGQAALLNEIEDLRGYLSNALTVEPTKVSKSNAQAVETIFESLKQESLKQAARIKLGLRGASEGLIDLILGRSDWYELWLQIKQGIISLSDLQSAFNKTAAGVQELEDSLQAARDEAQAYIDEMQAEADRLYDIWQAAIAQAEAYKKSIAEISQIDILPTLEPEIGKFEQQIITTFDNIRAELSRGLEEGSIYQDAYNELLSYANKEAEILRGISRQRDDLANRYSLSEALIEEYKGALTSALSLTSLFSSIKTETEKRTVTEVSSSVVRLSGSLKEFNLTVSKSYEETVDKVISKSSALLTGFRDMAQKARDFAENLRTLRDMGLDPMLFDQLVQAGVEAGGETAQALVDGGSDTINEINGLFSEINALGGDLGEEVAATLYGSGIDMANGLLEGIRSQQSALEELARNMAEAFNKEFNARVDIATQAPVAAARDAYEQAQAAVPEMKQIDVDALNKLNGLIAGATRYIGNVTGDLATGGEFKKDIYEQLKQDVLSGAQLDLSGIQSGLSSEALQAAAAQSGSQSVTNVYNVNYGGTGNNTTAYSNGVSFANGIAAANASNPQLQVEMFGA